MTRDLLIIEDIDSMLLNQAKITDLIGRDRSTAVIAPNLSVRGKFHSLYPHFEAEEHWHFISTEDLNSCESKKKNTWLNWHKEAQLSFSHKGVDLLVADDTLRYWFFSDYYFLLMLFKKLIDHYHPQRIHLCSQETVQCMEYNHLSGLSYCILRHLSEKEAFELKPMNETLTFNKTPLFISTPHHDVSWSKQKTLINFSAIKDPMAVLKVFNSDSENNFRCMTGWFSNLMENEVPGESLLGIEPKSMSFQGKYTSSSRLKKLKKLFEKFFSNNNDLLFNNPHIKFVFDAIFEERLPRLMEVVDHIDHAFKTEKYKSLILCDHPLPDTLISHQIANIYGTSTFTLPHSCWPVWQDYLPNSEAQPLVWGSIASEYYNQSLNVKKKPIRLGSPRFNKVPQSDANEPESSFKILYVTNALTYSNTPVANPGSHIQLIKTLLTPPVDTDFEICIKHKNTFENEHFYSQFAPTSNQNKVRYTHKEALPSLFQTHHIAIALNLLSTAHLEAIAHNCPVIIFRNTPSHFDVEPQFPENIFPTYSEEDMWPTLKHFSDNRQKLNELLEKQSKWLYDVYLPKEEYSFLLLNSTNSVNTESVSLWRRLYDRSRNFDWTKR